MEILRAIERADALCPNPYTLEEKISWCDEVTASLRRNIIKIYGVIETEVDGCGELVLPDDIPFERVELVYVGNQLFNKYDFRSFAENFCEPRETGIKQKFRVIYLVLPKPVRNPEIVGEFNTGTDTIEIIESPFITGDTIEIATLSNIQEAPDWKKAEVVHVMEVRDDKIILDREALEAQTEAPLAIRRVIDDVTEIDEAPYDTMYIEYILAKCALYQHDYTSYNAHMTQYNFLYEELMREYGGRRPMTTKANFRNYSCV